MRPEPLLYLDVSPDHERLIGWSLFQPAATHKRDRYQKSRWEPCWRWLFLSSSSLLRKFQTELCFSPHRIQPSHVPFVRTCAMARVIDSPRPAPSDCGCNRDGSAEAGSNRRGNDLDQCPPCVLDRHDNGLRCIADVNRYIAMVLEWRNAFDKLLNALRNIGRSPKTSPSPNRRSVTLFSSATAS